MKNKINILGLALIFGLFTACGTAGTDPLSLMDNPFPPLNNIITGVSFPALTVPYTAGNPSWSFAGGFASFSYVAPANGIISEAGPNYVVILHSGRMATKITGLAIVTVRSGDTVLASQVVGSFASSLVQFSVFIDGVPVCPLSYMSPAFRAVFFAGFGGNPCQG